MYISIVRYALKKYFSISSENISLDLTKEDVVLKLFFGSFFNNFCTITCFFTKVNNTVSKRQINV